MLHRSTVREVIRDGENGKRARVHLAKGPSPGCSQVIHVSKVFAREFAARGQEWIVPFGERDGDSCRRRLVSSQRPGLARCAKAVAPVRVASWPGRLSRLTFVRSRAAPSGEQIKARKAQTTRYA